MVDGVIQSGDESSPAGAVGSGVGVVFCFLGSLQLYRVTRNIVNDRKDLNYTMYVSRPNRGSLFYQLVCVLARYSILA